MTPSTSTSVTTETAVTVETWTDAIAVATTETLALLEKFAAQRGLDTAYFQERADSIQDGVWTWLSSRHLDTVHLEVYRESQPEEAIERFDLPFALTAPGDADDDQRRRALEGDFASYHDEILRQVQTLEAPPADCVYRIVVTLHDTNDEGEPPPTVDGWQPTHTKDVDHLEKEQFGTALDAGIIASVANLWTGLRRPTTEVEADPGNEGTEEDPVAAPDAEEDA